MQLKLSFNLFFSKIFLNFLIAAKTELFNLVLYKLGYGIFTYTNKNFYSCR